MTDTRFTHALQTILHKSAAFIEGLPTDILDTLKLVGTLVADVATIKSQIASGNYAAVVPGVVSDVAAVKTELASLKSDVQTSLSTAASQTSLQAVTSSVADTQTDIASLKSAYATLLADFNNLKASLTTK